MSGRAIRINECNLVPLKSNLNQAALISAQTDRSCIFLVPHAELDDFMDERSGEFLIDRGTQHAAKSLPSYFGDRTGNLVLRTKYTDAGQLRRAIRTLLTNNRTPKTGARYFLGLDPHLFEQVWNDATEDANNGSHRNGGATMAELLAKHPRLRIPEDLRQVYVGSGPEMDTARHLIMLAARNNHPVLIQGESGTGKEVIARLIHQMGIGASGSFIAVNCGGIPESLLESELFGHTRGAFTGAFTDKEGLWKLADGGTLFLDEIGDLDENHQVKILRALEDGFFRPVGGEQEIRSNARIIAATNVDLQRLVEQGRFREDLYYRLFALRICAPPLRNHPQDIPELALHFWKKQCGDSQPLPAKTVLAALKHHPWRGNARELRAFILNVAALADGTPVDTELIHAVMQERYGYSEDR